MESAGHTRGDRDAHELRDTAPLGPYRPLTLLGQGGMGRVYRAVHEPTGTNVALKTVRAVDEARLASIRREIHALSRLRHPGVVRIMAQGVSRGVPWYAMELLTGPTLADILSDTWRARIATGTDPAPTLATASGTLELPSEDAPSTPASARAAHAGDAARPAPQPVSTATELLTLIRGLCPPLGYLHGRGVVHRDLKPDNVFVRPGGVPLITDLGIATHFSGAQGREQLVTDREVLGTHLYMAPEQIRGEHVDARADLYALGCILYQCVTGRPPFVGSATWVLKQHLEAAPAPPSRWVSDLPAELDALALALLAKSPGRRLGYAEDVDAALAALGVPSPYPAEAERARPYLYRPRLVGRDAPLSALRAALARALDGRGGGRALVGGESGVGKTRLVMELAHAAGQRGAAVISGQCQGLRSEHAREGWTQTAPLAPLLPLLTAIADRCREHGAALTERLLGVHGHLLANYEPSLAVLPRMGEPPATVELPPEQARERLLHALRSALFAFAAERPVLLVIDDLQWADELSLAFLRSLNADALGTSRVLVVGTYRMDEAGSALESIARDPGTHHIELGRLDESDVRTLVRDMLALDEAPERFAAFLARTSSGNPYFIAEYMHAAIAEGLIRRDQHGTWRVRATGDQLESALPLPDSLSGLIERRIAELAPASRALVELAAVLGRAFDGAALGAGAALEEGELLDAIDRLRRRQILEEGDAGQLRFVHDKLRENAYAGIAGERRIELHRRAARAIETTAGDAPNAAQAIARHWASAGDDERAAPQFLRAGDVARAAYANREAAELYRAAVERLPALMNAASDEAARDGWRARLCRAQERLGDMRAALGEQDAARAAFGHALALLAADDHVRRAGLHRKLGTSWQTHHQHADALSEYRAAEAALGAPADDRPAPWWQEWFQLQEGRIYVHYWQAQVDEMTALVERVRPVVHARGTPLQRASFFDGLLHLWLRRQRYQLGPEAQQAAQRAFEAARESGDAACLANARFMLGLALLFAGELGELPRAEREMAHAMADAERIGDVTLASRCVTYAAIIARRRGRVDDTERLAERALAAAKTARMLDYLGAARANLAWAAWRRGDSARARALGLDAIAPWDELAESYPYGMQWPGRLLLIALALDQRCDADIDAPSEITRVRPEASSEASPEASDEASDEASHDTSAEAVAEAVGHARVLLEDTQVALPRALAEPLGHALTAAEAGAWADSRTALERAVSAARQCGYL